MNTIGERIKEVRKDFSLTQTEFGKKIGVSHSHISKIESNKEMPSDSVIKLICVEFGINESWLREGSGTKKASVSITDRQVLFMGLKKVEELLQSGQNTYSYILYLIAEIISYDNISEKYKEEYLLSIESILNTIYRCNIYFNEISIKKDDLKEYIYLQDKFIKDFDKYKKEIHTTIDEFFKIYMAQLIDNISTTLKDK